MDAINKIYIGDDIAHPLFSFSGTADIESVKLTLSSSISGDELAIDQFMPVVYDGAYIRVSFIPEGSAGLTTADGKHFQVFPSANFLDKLSYGTPVWYYRDNDLLGKFYSQRIVRTGKTKFDILAVSSIGILDGQTNNGGLYSGQSFSEVASDIIGNAVSFSCADDVSNISVFGWLPKATKRENLHQLLFAYGVTADKDEGGNLVFRFPDTESVKTISDNRIFLGGSVDYKTPASRVDVTEHAFMKLPTDEIITLFDNTDGSGIANHTTIDFQDAPVYNLSGSKGLTIHESGVNYAVISGTGILTGRKYTHTTKIISINTDTAGEEKIVSVTDATLVSIANSEYVARRVLSYYASAKTITADITVAGEKTGELVSFTNPFDESETAFLSSMDITASTIMRASCELITNYIPRWFGNIYSHADLLTGSGVWVKPNGVEQCRAVLIGAGDGGSSGVKGETATGGWYTTGNPGKGGKGGQAGLGGKILSVVIDLHNIDSLLYSCGIGGAGGIGNGFKAVAGEVGGETVLSEYSSEKGSHSVSGCVNLFTGKIYGLSGVDGLPGGDGCGTSEDSEPIIGLDGTIYNPGKRGANSYLQGSDFVCRGQGGAGGGAAAGADGADGGDGETRRNQGHGYGTGGNGGNGAHGGKGEDGLSFGCGGSGGHGGGGGGTGGDSYNDNGNDYRNNGDPGTGGDGGNGGNGENGCILIYY